jgi:hypothetical protein
MANTTLNAARIEALFSFMEGRAVNLDEDFFKTVRGQLGLPRPEVDKLIDHLVEAGCVKLTVSCGRFVIARTTGGTTCAR